MRVLLELKDDTLVSARLLPGAWIVLPAKRTSNGSQIVIGNGGSMMNGWTVFPPKPNPIADFNKNGVVNMDDSAAFFAAFAASSATADVNHDGANNVLDVDMFNDRWNYWSQP